MNSEEWARMSELFHQGLPLSEPERNRLLADEVRDLETGANLRELWAHADPPGFLEEPLFRAEADGEGLSRIGNYRVVSVLGEGGMGVVYLGVQDTPIHRQVAIKVVKTALNSRGIVARFESERQTLALMDHPNIAQLYEADVREDRWPYFVMEYVQGLPITEYCDRNILGCRDRLLLFQQVCYAVQHAHQRGIIHRDLKPSNILIAVKDGKPVPKVIDFGVAKALNQRLGGQAAVTEFGMLIGTPEYMSPEQADHSADVDTTSDVYSLGVVLYELLVGVLPFDAKALLKAGLREIEPPRPTLRVGSLGECGPEVARKRRTDLPSLIRQLRGDLDWIVMKALEKDRRRRYSSASEFAADIHRNLSDQPVLAGPASSMYQLRKLVRRHRVEFAAAAILLLVIIAAVVTSTMLYFSAERARVLAEGQAYKASLAAARSSIEGSRSAEARETLLSIPPALRKWEWRYLYWLSDTSAAILNSGEGGKDIHIGFSGDGSGLVISTATSVHTWKLGSFVRTGDYGPFGRIVSMSRDGSLVVSEVGSGMEVATTTRKAVCRFDNSGAPLVDASFDAGGIRLATLAQDNQANVWDIKARRLITSIRPLRTPLPRLTGRDHELIALSPDGAIVAKTEYSDIRLHDAVSGRSIALLQGTHGPVESLSFSYDGRRLISASGSADVWDVKTGKLILEPAFQRAFSNATASPNGGTLAVAGWYHAVHFLNPASGELLETAPTPSIATLSALAWSPQGTYLVGIDFSGGVRVWHGPTLGGQSLQRLQDEPLATFDPTRPENGLSEMTMNADGSRIVVAAGPEIRVADAYAGKLLSVLKTGSSFPIRALAQQPGTDRLASGSADKTIMIWSTASPVPLRRLVGHQGTVTALAYSPDGASLISGSDDRTLRFWNAGTGELRFTRKLAGEIFSLAISPDGGVVAVVLNGQSYTTGEPPIQLLDVHTGAALSQLERIDEDHSAGHMQHLAFSPDGKWLVASDGGMLGAALWEVRTGKQVRRLLSAGKQGYGATAFAFSPDGQRLAGSFGGGNIAFWNPQNGQLLLELLADAKQVTFSPDGSRLYISAYVSIEILDTKPAYPAEAEELWHSLQERFPLLCDLRSFLQKGKIDPDLRNAALRLTDRRQESSRVVRQFVDNVLNSGSSGRAAYETALGRSRIISETYPWDQAALVRLGAALYRTEAYGNSLAALQRATPLEPAAALRKQIFMALVYYRLGDVAKGRELFDAARLSAKQTVLAQQDANAIAGLLREVESVLSPNSKVVP